MSAKNVLTKVFNRAPILAFDDVSKIVIMSDCHRGDGTGADGLMKNRNLYQAALNRYFDECYTYIELGDGDELWENRCFSDISQTHRDSLEILSKFYNQNRMHMIYGNHDMVKKNPNWVKKNLESFDGERGKPEPLFPNIKPKEGIVLRHSLTGVSLFLLHGHQVDLLNYQLWRLGRFLVRYFWRPLQLLGIQDPTSAAKNNKVKKSTERRLLEWAEENNQILIAGHTHHAVFPDEGEDVYFNDGCCVHSYSLTAVEIVQSKISLVKWSVKANKDGVLFVAKDILNGPIKLTKRLKTTKEIDEKGF